VFADIAKLLADGRRYLAGNTLSAADITLASLSSVVLAPPQHPMLLPYEDTPPGARAVIDRYRATPVGQFVLRLYREDRSARARSSASVEASAAK
jgi:glutathione S-transferase